MSSSAADPVSSPASGARLRLRRDVEWLPADGERPALVARGDDVVRLRGVAVERLLEALEQGLEVEPVGPGPAPAPRGPGAETVPAAVPAGRLPPPVRGLLDTLARLGLLERSAGPREAAARPRPDGPFDTLEPSPGTLEPSPRRRFELLGSPALTAPLADALKRLELGPGGAPIGADHVTAAGEAVDRPPIPVVLFEGFRLGGLAELDRTFATTGRLWIPVSRSGDALWVGPVLDPSAGPCFACWRHRLIAASSHPEELERLERARSGRSALDGHPGAEPWPAAVWSWLARQLSALAARRRPGQPGTQLELDLVTGALGRHILLAVPDCPSCAPGMPDQPARLPENPGAGSTARRIRQPPADPPDPWLLDPRLGLVRDARRRAPEADDPRLEVWVVTGARVAPPPRREVRPLLGVGVAPERSAALSSALAEAVERYGASVAPPAAALRSATWRELQAGGEAAVDPREVAPFTPEQCVDLERRLRSPWRPRPFDSDTRTGWVCGTELATGAPIQVPAALVHLPYHYRPDEPFWTDCASTGLALDRTLEGALRRSLLEVVERDATALGWLARARWPELDPASLPRLAGLLDGPLACSDSRLLLADLTTDLGLPVIVALLAHRRGGVVLGSAARGDRQEAAIAATLEAHQARISCKRWLAEDPGPPLEPDEVLDFPDHARFYTHPDHARRVLARLAPETRSAEPAAHSSAEAGSEMDDAGRLAQLVRSLAEHGLRPIGVDLTPSDLAAAGYWLTRAVIPGLVPLNGRHPLLPLGLQRVRAAARREPLDLTPHPFP